jgi:hypothetical protein
MKWRIGGGGGGGGLVTIGLVGCTGPECMSMLGVHVPSEGQQIWFSYLLPIFCPFDTVHGLDSLNGENFHYGTPCNPAAPTRVPGGGSFEGGRGSSPWWWM